MRAARRGARTTRPPASVGPSGFQGWRSAAVPSAPGSRLAHLRSPSPDLPVWTLLNRPVEDADDRPLQDNSSKTANGSRATSQRTRHIVLGCPLCGNCSSPTDREIAIRVFRAATELGLRHGRRLHLRRPLLAAPLQGRRVVPDRPAEGRRAGQGRTSTSTRIIAVAQGARRRRDPPRATGSSPRTPSFARACEDERHHVRRPDAGAARDVRRQDRRQAARDEGGRADRPRHRARRSTDADDVKKAAKEIGYPAHHQGQLRRRRARDARRRRTPTSCAGKLEEAQREAGAAFGRPEVFLERYIAPRQAHRGADPRRHARQPRAPLGARLLGAAPAPEGRRDRAEHQPAAASCAQRHLRRRRAALPGGRATATPAPSSSSSTSTRDEFFFIEVNPRIQVEHTVTEVVTGIDLVKSQILVAQGHKLHEPPLEHPAAGRDRDAAASRSSAASRPKTRRTTSSPTTAGITTYRSPGGFAIRLDGGNGFGGAVITPYFDSLLVKLHDLGRDVRRGVKRRTARCASSASAA